MARENNVVFGEIPLGYHKSKNEIYIKANNFVIICSIIQTHLFLHCICTDTVSKV